MNVATSPWSGRGLLDGELQEMGVVGGVERVGEARVDLPVRGVVLLVHADEREPQVADVVLHLADNAFGVDRGGRAGRPCPGAAGRARRRLRAFAAGGRTRARARPTSRARVALRPRSRGAACHEGRSREGRPSKKQSARQIAVSRSHGSTRSVERSGRTCMSRKLTSSRRPVPSGMTPTWSMAKTDTQKLMPSSWSSLE